MIKLALAIAGALLVSAVPAAAQLQDNFDGEAGGATVTNYTGFANFDVTSGSVDLLHDPNGFGLGCAGGAGSSCIDLDGSTGQGGTLRTKSSYSFDAGDTIALSFDLAGNGRSAGLDSFFAGFQFAGPVNVQQYSALGAPGVNFGFTSNVTTFGAIPYNAPFSTYTFSFLAGSAGSLNVRIGTRSNDNIGPILDNFNLVISGAVPEPSQWLLLILGFGAVGHAMRRRRTVVARFA